MSKRDTAVGHVYRPDIDGLRALAVLPVVFYHVKLPGFSGGFVGVDVFFVISGFLITSILLRDLSEGKFSFVGFYERRMRRIVPALLIVLLFVLIFSPIALLPSQSAGVFRDALAALLFVSNINFWSQSGYFEADAEIKPLLHTWSLGVEEQFYLFAPIAFWTIYRFGASQRWLLIILALMASFLACVILTPLKPSASFYLLPTRAWELLSGASLAVISAPGARAVDAGRTKTMKELCGLAGFALLLFAVFAFSSETSFPGSAAMVPVLGSTLLLWAGRESFAGRVLSGRLLVAIGSISYSLYLWHWPIVVFARERGWLEPMTGKIAVISFSVLAAWLTFRFVESPTRDRSRWPTRRLCQQLLGASSLVAVLSFAAIAMPAIPLAWHDPEVVAFDRARFDFSPQRENCHVHGGLPDLDHACILGGSAPRVAVWGDSQGVELAFAIGEVGIPVKQITYSACPPTTLEPLPWNRPQCLEHNRRVFQYLKDDASLRTVVLASRYSSTPDAISARNRPSVLPEQIWATALALRRAGKHVIVVGPTPKLPGRVDLPTHLARGGAKFTDSNEPWLAAFRQKMSAVSTVVMPTDLFCEKNGRCNLLARGSPILFDATHPSMHASRIVARHLAPMIVDGQSTPPLPMGSPANPRPVHAGGSSP